MTNDTICAVSTAPGMGAIAVIRISGPETLTITDSIFASVRKNFRLKSSPTHTAHFGSIVNDNGETIDDVVASVYLSPKTFTGEDLVEISCHGSHYIQQEILKLLISKGCRMAEPGEFTQRAFANGKMDLSQAEAVADLIASQNKAAHRLAMTQMKGGFSDELSQLREKLLKLTSLVELELDFSDQGDVEFADRTTLKNLSTEISRKIENLTKSFSKGNAIKNGIPVAIIGETNVGKSTLLNRLLREEKAIVSDIHGTTRDAIEDTMTIHGVSFRFIDTAGLRETTDAIETIGIERSFKMLDRSSIVLWVIDASKPTADIGHASNPISDRLIEKKTILVFNKCDLLSEKEKKSLSSEADKQQHEAVFISAKNDEEISDLEERIFEAAQLPDVGNNDVIVTNIRHFEALSKAQESIKRIEEGLRDNISGDFLSQDIRECIHYLGEITGEITTDEILGNIFKNFCVGK